MRNRKSVAKIRLTRAHPGVLQYGGIELQGQVRTTEVRGVVLVAANLI